MSESIYYAFGVAGASPRWTSNGKLRLPDLMK
jgi:hypothetical protein